MIPSMAGKVLEKILTSKLFEVDLAWTDDNTSPIATYMVQLQFSVLSIHKITPCEMPTNGRFPALGLEFKLSQGPGESLELLEPLIPFDVLDRHLPARVFSTVIWDDFGEGLNSAIQIYLEDRCFLIIKHMLPPMTLGIEISLCVGKNFNFTKV
jgi:hypothetical protein